MEALSPGTQSVDFGIKLRDYFQLSSVQQYLMINPEKRLLIHYLAAMPGCSLRAS
ncbi:MAG: Uma2 family endonuclease [Chitinophagales bacterium]|nr:Uma2 family endonuclease [Hyphomicrobiales bacterium]